MFEASCVRWSAGLRSGSPTSSRRSRRLLTTYTYCYNNKVCLPLIHGTGVVVYCTLWDFHMNFFPEADGKIFRSPTLVLLFPCISIKFFLKLKCVQSGVYILNSQKPCVHRFRPDFSRTLTVFRRTRLEHHISE
jgi:hypothetical protein